MAAVGLSGLEPNSKLVVVEEGAGDKHDGLGAKPSGAVEIAERQNLGLMGYVEKMKDQV